MVTGFYYASFEVLTAVLMNIRFFLNVTPCKNGKQTFESVCCLLVRVFILLAWGGGHCGGNVGNTRLRA